MGTYPPWAIVIRKLCCTLANYMFLSYSILYATVDCRSEFHAVN